MKTSLNNSYFMWDLGSSARVHAVERLLCLENVVYNTKY